MYVTRRLLRSTLEEVTKPPMKDPPMVSPRRRRPLADTQPAPESKVGCLKTNAKSDESSKNHGPKAKPIVCQAENEGDKKNNKASGAATVTLRGLGMLIDARDTSERWCEAKILKLNPEEKTIFIHFVGWNSRYDTWLDASCVAAHGKHTGAAKKSNMSWNGKESLFADPSVKTSRIKQEPTVTVSVEDKKRKRGSKSSNEASMEAKSPSNKKMKKELPSVGELVSSKRKDKTPAIHVRVDALDEESERKSRRNRKTKIDLELEMDVRGEPPSSKDNGRITKKAKVSPKVSPKAPTPTGSANSPARHVSPRTPTVKHEAKDVESGPTKTFSPTVGMSALRRSSRAAASSSHKKKKKVDDDDESDEDYVDEEEAEEEEEDDDDEDEVDDSEGDDDDMRSRSRRSAYPDTSKSSSSSRSFTRHTGPITQWQTDPAFGSTREKLASIFRQRLQQRGELPSPTFRGSFQHAMKSRTVAKKKQSKRASKKSDHSASSDDEEDAEEDADAEAAAAAAYYYAQQHQYHMQAYQYHQYMFHQAMLAHQAQLHAEATGTDTGTKKEGGEGGEDQTSEPQKPTENNDTPVMNGGIIDPRFIQARMDALEQQRRVHEQLYLQHYQQSTERNLQMLAASPEILRNGAKMWQDHVINGHQTDESEEKADTSKNDEPRAVESATQSPTNGSPPPENTPSPVKSAATGSPAPATPQPTASPATSDKQDTSPEAKTGGVLFEMVL